VTGNAADDYERRAPGTAGMRHGVRYQIYEAKDGFVLFQASEREFWKNFCAGVDRMDLFERWPGARVADHAPGNRELQAELRTIFGGRTAAEWIAFGDEHNTPIAPVNTPQTLAADPQFRHRLPFHPRQALGAEQLPSPIKLIGEDLPAPTKAPTPGQHTDEVLAELLGYGPERIAELRDAGALG
jgi:crotonobetainyl-CoA:carnitine CoA-transferase CaiB-like acyl-CoA transferase